MCFCLCICKLIIERGGDATTSGQRMHKHLVVIHEILDAIVCTHTSMSPIAAHITKWACKLKTRTTTTITTAKINWNVLKIQAAMMVTVDTRYTENTEYRCWVELQQQWRWQRPIHTIHKMPPAEYEFVPNCCNFFLSFFFTRSFVCILSIYHCALFKCR